jgi:vacuolar iron transporter family protein
MTLEDRARELERHIQEEHKQSALSAYLKEIIYGGVDGIITTFAVVAGFSGAALSSDTTIQLTSMVVLLFGLANLLADGISMGLGNFLSTRSDQSLYATIRRKEEHEIVHNTDVEIKETITILMERGFTEHDAQTIASLYKKNPNYWIDFMMTNELKIADPRNEHPVYTGIATFVSFVIFGIIPLLPFLFMQDLSSRSLFEVSAFGTILALVLLGCFKAEVVGGSTVRSIGETVLIGGSAALVAFFVGALFVLS